MGQCFGGNTPPSNRRLSISTDHPGVDFFRQQQLIERFTHDHLDVLRRRFEAALRSGESRLNRDDFERLLPPFLFPCFDLDRQKSLSFRDFCVGLAVGTFGSDSDLLLFLSPLKDFAPQLSVARHVLSAFPPLIYEHALAEELKNFHCLSSHHVCANPGWSSPCASPAVRAADSMKTIAVVSQRWLASWLLFLEQSEISKRPGLIDSDSLVSSEELGLLREGLLEEYDFGVVPMSLFGRLLQIYGVASTKSVIPRRQMELQPKVVVLEIIRGERKFVRGLVSQRDSVTSLALSLVRKHLEGEYGGAFVLYMRSEGEGQGDKVLVERDECGNVFCSEKEMYIRHLGSNQCINLVLLDKQNKFSDHAPCLLDSSSLIPAPSAVLSRSLWRPDMSISPLDLSLNEDSFILTESLSDGPKHPDSPLREPLLASWERSWLGSLGAGEGSFIQWISVSGGLPMSSQEDNGALVPREEELLPGSSQVSNSGDSSHQTGETKTLAGVGGMRNLGNTCFMNSVLQCLVHTEYVRNFFLSPSFQRLLTRKSTAESVREGSLAENLEIVLRKMQSGTGGGTVDMRKFKKTSDELAPEFSDRMQHDAHEYFSRLLDLLHEELLQLRSSSCCPESTLVTELFEGVLEVRLECENCGRAKRSADVVRSLPVVLPAKEGEALLRRTFNVVLLNFGTSGNPRRVRVSGVGSVEELYRRVLGQKSEIWRKFAFVENVDKSGRAGKIVAWTKKHMELRELKDETDLVMCDFQACRPFSSSWLLLDSPLHRLNLLGSTEPGGAPEVTVIVQHRREGGVSVFGVPFLLRTSEDGDCRGLYRAVQEKCMQYFGTSEFRRILLTDSRGRNCGRTRCDAAAGSIPGDREGREREGTGCRGCELQKYRVQRLGEISALQAGKIYLAVEWEMRHIDKVVIPMFSSPPELDSGRPESGGKLANNRSNISLSECVKQTLQSERVEDVDCEECGKRGVFLRKAEFEKFPEILVLVVKRFSFCMFGYGVKRQDAVEISDQIEISGQNYELFACLNHEGSLSGSGHYTAVVRARSSPSGEGEGMESAWVRCDDEKVQMVSGEGMRMSEICRKSCYMLFYKNKFPGVATLVTYSSASSGSTVPGFSRSSSVSRIS